jgi:hypothetical protein
MHLVRVVLVCSARVQMFNEQTCYARTHKYATHESAHGRVARKHHFTSTRPAPPATLTLLISVLPGPRWNVPPFMLFSLKGFERSRKATNRRRLRPSHLRDRMDR